MALNPLSVGQMTPASRLLIAQAHGRAGGRMSAKRRKRRASAAAPRKRRAPRARARARGRARLVKGSPAARRYMAKIRRMRKRK